MQNDRKYPTVTKLVPYDNEEAYGRFEEACSVELSYFAAAAETLGTELFIKKYNFCHTYMKSASC